jgi:hypothetical protein
MKDDVTPTDKPTRKTNGEGSVLGFAPWLNGNHAFESWAQSGTNMVAHAADLSEELMGFWQSRFEADLNEWRALASCRNPGEFFECQKQFAEKAMAQYRDEANKLTSRIVGLVNSTASPFQQEPPSKS